MGTYGTNPFRRADAEDFASWSDKDWDDEEESVPPWEGRPSLLDQGDLLRKAIKEEA